MKASTSVADQVLATIESPAVHVVAEMSGVSLVRFGPHGKTETRYEVIEPDHVAGFSRLAHPHPLDDAVTFFINRANARYHQGAPFPTGPPEEG